MIFKIDDYNTFETMDQVAEYISQNLDDSYYDDMIDEAYGDVEVCGYAYSASIVLRAVDEIAYGCGFSDFQDSIYGDVRYELERMSDGDVESFYGFEVEAIAESDDE